MHSARNASLRVRRTARAFALLAAFALAGIASAAGAQTLKAVKERGTLNCGVSQGLAGFSARDDKGQWSGFDVDFCRAIAAAVFDDPGKVTFVPLSANERFEALQAGKIDVLSRNSTWTMSRETALRLMFAAVTYYDGQGFLVRAGRNATSALELGGASVCVQAATTTELNLADFFPANGMTYQAMTFPTLEAALAAYDGKRCDVYSADVSQLYAVRLGLQEPDDHVILPDIVSKEPLGPAVRQGDDQWLNVVKWTHFAMINGEELGVGKKTVAAAAASAKPDVKRLIGSEGDYGTEIGLTNDWAARILRHVGHYGEVYERNVGSGSRLAIPRGINHLWSKGGIQYAPPIR